MRPLELTRSGMVGTLAVLVVVAVCVRLGLWQLDRRQDKLERNAAMVTRLEAPPVSLASMPRDSAGLGYRRAELSGVADPDRSVVLAGRSYRGAPGVHLLTPVRTVGGAVLVNRGWMPSPDASSVELGGVELHGEVRVEGVLIPFPDVESAAGEEAGFRTTWYRLDGERIRAQFPYDVAPLYLLATAPAGSTPPDTGRALPVVLDAPSPDPGPHLSYAIQWFSFAAIFLIGWLVLLARGTGRDSGEVDPA